MKLSREATEIVLELIEDYTDLVAVMTKKSAYIENTYQELVALKLKQPTGEAVFYNADDTSGWKKAKGVIE